MWGQVRETFALCVFSSKCHNKGWAGQFKQHILVSHNAGGWKGQAQGAGGSGTIACFGLQMATFL